MELDGRLPDNPAPVWADRLVEKAMTLQSILMDEVKSDKPVRDKRAIAALTEMNSEVEGFIRSRLPKNKRPRKTEVA